jgi:hypothetical protein
VLGIPVALRYKAAPTPAARRGWGRAAKVAGLLLFVLAWMAVGGFVLPGRSRPAADPAPAVDTTVPQAFTQGQPDPPAEATPAPPDRALLARPRYDGPAVAPQLPPGGGALDLALAVDRELDRRLGEAGVPPSPVADDAEFLRRACLDLTGRIPTYEQAVTFLDSNDPYKRSRLIDDLLASPHFGRHFANIWCDLLVKRDFDSNRGLRTEPFVRWLADEFNRNEKWDRIVTAMLTAEGADEDNPATFFFLANQDNNQPSPAKLVGATGNLFLGIQIQCAECHVHPFHDRWKPADFWGLAAFFGHTRAQRGGNAKRPNAPARIVELASGEKLPPMGKKKKLRTEPAPVGATIAIPDPSDPRKTRGQAVARFLEGPAPALGRSGPYRPTLAAWVASARNPYFAAAQVNRLWAHFFARGLVNPLDDMKPDSPPSHPEVLQRLSREFAASGYDVKFLIRALCNTRAYQRTSRPLPGNASHDKLLSRMPVKVLGARALLDSLATATGHEAGSANPEFRRGKPGGGNGKGRVGDVGPVRFFDTREYDDDPTEFSSGVPQVLRLMNSELSNRSAEVVGRLARPGRTSEQVIEGLFLTALSRRPSAAETRRLADYVAEQGEPAKGYAGVFWVLLNSAEFACNR